MVALTGLLSAVLLVPAVFAAPQVSPLVGTCKTVAPCVSTLRTYSSRSAFCSSWLSLTTRTTTAVLTSSVTNTATSTVTSTTGTDTVAASETVTVLAHGESIIDHAVSETVTAHITTTWAPTPTVTAHVSLTTVTTTSTTLVCGNAKRAAPTIPSVLKAFKSSIISSGCSCLSLPLSTRTVSTTTSVTTTTTSTETRNVAATATTTPTTTLTYRTTSTPTITTTFTPTTTLTPDPTTTTPVSTVTETRVSTVRVGQAAVQLAHPTPITPVGSNGRATENLDDQTGWRINNIPFDVGLYGVNSRRLIVGLNGWISPGSTESFEYRNTALPNSAIGDPTWAAYWSDLYIYRDTAQGIYYEISGEAPHRTLSVEYFMSFFGNRNGYTHFMITLFEDEIGRVVYSYFQTTSQLASTNDRPGTIGVQRPATGTANQYSYGIQPREGLVIEWRPSTNQWREISAGSC